MGKEALSKLAFCKGKAMFSLSTKIVKPMAGSRMSSNLASRRSEGAGAGTQHHYDHYDHYDQGHWSWWSESYRNFCTSFSAELFLENPRLASLWIGEKVWWEARSLIAQSGVLPKPTWKSHRKIKQKCPEASPWQQCIMPSLRAWSSQVRLWGRGSCEAGWQPAPGPSFRQSSPEQVGCKVGTFSGVWEKLTGCWGHSSVVD